MWNVQFPGDSPKQDLTSQQLTIAEIPEATIRPTVNPFMAAPAPAPTSRTARPTTFQSEGKESEESEELSTPPSWRAAK
jgi:hypothetical protein